MTQPLRPPSLADLATDYSAEIARFRAYWVHFVGRVEKFQSPRTGRMLRRHHAPAYDPIKLKSYLMFLQEQLNRPELLFHGSLREIFAISHNQRAEYEAFIRSEGIASAEFQSIYQFSGRLDDYALLSAALRAALYNGIANFDQFWETLTDPYIGSLFLAAIIQEPLPKQKHGLRVFCAQCHHLDGATERVVQQVKDSGFEASANSRLLQIKQEMISELSSFGEMVRTGEMDQDGYNYSELWMVPMIEAVEPDIDWRQLCGLAGRFSHRLAKYRSGGENLHPEQVCDLLRCTISFD